jgi:hypothetical protein
LFFFSPTTNSPCLLWLVFHTIFCSTVTFLPVLPFLYIYFWAILFLFSCTFLCSPDLLCILQGLSTFSNCQFHAT